MQSPVKPNGLALKQISLEISLSLSLFSSVFHTLTLLLLLLRSRLSSIILFYSRGFATICSIWMLNKSCFFSGWKTCGRKMRQIQVDAINLWPSFFLSLIGTVRKRIIRRHNRKKKMKRENKEVMIHYLARLSEVFVHSAKLGRS